jgi:GT2 family glycosyltransferase/glycosyltransferase involved in cell wall biosynthesis
VAALPPRFMTKAVVCIAGAHRSGTSMLTRLLHRCGLYLGPENDIMPAAADNPDGFWEHLRFVRLNDEILNAVGAAWDLPPRGKDDFEGKDLQPMRVKAQFLIEEFAGQPVWGWKDPRNSLTLPFWQSLLPNLKTVIIIRNPLEVAYSMHKRNGTSYALGLRLWEIYNRRLLAETNPQQRFLTNYAAFFTDPQTELRRIANFVGLENGEDFAEAVSLVAVQRRHTAFTMDQMIDAGVAQPIVALYKTLLEGTTGHEIGKAGSKHGGLKNDELAGTESQLRTTIPDSEETREELALRRGAEIQHKEEVARHQKTIEALRQELGDKSVRAAAEINRRDGRIEELQKAYAHLDQLLHDEQAERNKLFAELERLRRQSWEKLEATRQQLACDNEKLEAAHQDLEAARQQSERDKEKLEATGQQLARDKEDITQLRERFLQTNELLQKSSLRLTDFESRNAVLTERLRKQLLELKRLLRLLDQIDEAALLLRSSRRWKLANPFAALLAAMSGKSLPGFGYLDKNVEKYRAWRANHPEMASLADEIQALRPREIFPPAPASQTESTLKAEPTPVVKPPRPERPVSFAKYDQVEVSIVIPVYNQVDFTHACLAAVQQHSGDISFEVIVVDDASTDATPDIIGGIPGITYLRADTNAGFIASCNRGAEMARGNFLAFLNNDTTVTSGWLSALRETFDFEPKAGLVGSKLVYPDGRLQEAGGIIWRDGSGWNRGKFQDPGKPEYNYLKEVDYCSAASLMVQRALFAEVGGFDAKYAPGYYEDTDLAFKVAQRGKKVLYQPLSVVTHYEGVTGGTDTSTGAKRFQTINQETFTASWGMALADKPENGDLISYETLPPGTKRILVIDHHLPMPDRDSGSLRMYHILTILHDLGHRVIFLPDNLADTPPYTGDLEKRGIEVVHYPYIKSARAYLEAHGLDFDIVILSRCDFARKHIADVRRYAPNSRLIFDTVDLHFLREDREAALTQNLALKESATAKRELEYSLVEKADQTWVVSSIEQELLRAAHPDKSVEVVSNIVSVPGSATPFSLRRDILFIGSFQHPPNTDAVLFFARDIFPRVQQQLPATKFYIVGDKAPPEVIRLADESIIVTGYQPDVRCYFDHIKLSLAPLRFGAGVKGKINQSMGFGVPVVATSLAIEGMDLNDREDVLVADDPESFANAVIQLYRSDDLWDRLSRQGIKKAQESYSVEAARKQLLRLLSTHHVMSYKGHPANEALRTDSRVLIQG